MPYKVGRTVALSTTARLPFGPYERCSIPVCRKRLELPAVSVAPPWKTSLGRARLRATVTEVANPCSNQFVHFILSMRSPLRANLSASALPSKHLVLPSVLIP